MLSHFHLYRELRFSGVMGRRNGLLGLREDDDDDVHYVGFVLLSFCVNIQGRNFGVKSGSTNSAGELGFWVLRRERKRMESKCPLLIRLCRV